MTPLIFWASVAAEVVVATLALALTVAGGAWLVADIAKFARAFRWWLNRRRNN